MQQKYKLTDQAQFLNDLHTLIAIGFSLKVSLTLIETKLDNKRYIKMLDQGSSFYDLLNEEKFDNDVLLLVKIGLDSDSFVNTIGKATKLLENKIVKRNQLFELIKYPLMLIVISIISLLFVSLFLLPQFSNILRSFNASSNATVILYNVFKIGPYVICSILLIITAICLIIYKLSFDNQLSVIMRIKFIKAIYISLYNQVFTLSISNLLKSNIDLKTTLLILSDQTHNKLLSRECQKIITGLEEGKYISECITSIYYDWQLIEILKLGEQTGMIVYYLDSYSKLITNVNESRGKKILYWFQPLFYAIFGILILLLYAAIFIPMFTLMDNI